MSASHDGFPPSRGSNPGTQGTRPDRRGLAAGKAGRISRAGQDRCPLAAGKRAADNAGMSISWPGPAVLASALSALVAVEATSALVGSLMTGMSFAIAVDTFLLPNAVIGVGCGVCGALIAWQRPRNPLGWLLLGAGVCQTGTAGVTPWFVAALVDGAPSWIVRTLSTVYALGWPWSISLFIPLALLVFPDGRLPGPLWRWAARAAIVGAPVQVLIFGTDPHPLGPAPSLAFPRDGRDAGWLVAPGSTGVGWLWVVSNGLLTAVLLAALLGLVVRYRRGDEQARRQLLWLLLAATVAVCLITVSRLGPMDVDAGFPIVLLLGFALVPASMTIGVLRYQLLDIRLVWSRTVTYALLTAGVILAYAGIVTVVDIVLRQEIGLGASALVTLAVAAAFNPVRVRLQRRVDRLLYGESRDPVHAASSVSAQLAAGTGDPAGVLPVLCHALRLPYAALRQTGQLLGEHGSRPAQTERFPLGQARESLGELEVGVRSGQRELSSMDRAVLNLVAAPITVALQAAAVSAATQRSRQEERRRLRADLHDGLGPTLTGIAFQADAVVNLVVSDPGRAQELSQQIRDRVTGAIDEVRRLISQLRPVALDELGLIGALREQAQLLSRRSDGTSLEITVRARSPLPGIPPEVEVAAYRIVTEALTNAVRHSRAARIDVDVALTGEPVELLLAVQDDDSRPGEQWQSGVGLESMHERVAELGGTVRAGPTPQGGLVQARLPIAGAGP